MKANVKTLIRKAIKLERDIKTHYAKIEGNYDRSNPEHLNIRMEGIEMASELAELNKDILKLA